MVCPNPECQKKVEIDIKKQRDKNAAMKLKSEQRLIQRKIERDALKALGNTTHG